MNPLPGLTPDYSDLCLIANGAKIDYRTLIGEILLGRDQALARARRGEAAAARGAAAGGDGARSGDQLSYPPARPCALSRCSFLFPFSCRASAASAQTLPSIDARTWRPSTDPSRRPRPRAHDDAGAVELERRRVRELLVPPRLAHAERPDARQRHVAPGRVAPRARPRRRPRARLARRRGRRACRWPSTRAGRAASPPPSARAASCRRAPSAISRLNGKATLDRRLARGLRPRRARRR